MSKSFNIKKNEDIDVIENKNFNTELLLKEWLPLFFVRGKKYLVIENIFLYIILLTIPLICMFVFFHQFWISFLFGKILFFTFLTFCSLIVFILETNEKSISLNYSNINNFFAVFSFLKLKRKYLRNLDNGINDEVFEIAKVLSQNNYIYYSDSELMEIYEKLNYNNEDFLTFMFEVLLKNKNSWLELDANSNHSFNYISNFFGSIKKIEDRFAMFIFNKELKKKRKKILKEKKEDLLGGNVEKEKTENLDGYVDKRYIR